MRVIHVVLLITIVASLSALVDAKKKKSGSEDNRRPTSVEALLYCNSCQAVVRETLKKVKDSRKEYDVANHLKQS